MEKKRRKEREEIKKREEEDEGARVGERDWKKKSKLGAED